MSRTRSSGNRYLISGTLWVYLNPTAINRRVRYDRDISWCQDVVGDPHHDHGLMITHTYNRCHVLSGREWHTKPNGEQVLLSEYARCPSLWAPSPESGASQFPDPTLSDLLAMAPEIVARANPSAPHISVPTFIGELKDVPGGIRDLTGVRNLPNIVPTVRNWGTALLRAAATGYIQWRWAVKPMVADVRRMLSFAEASHKRFNELRRMADGKEIRRKVKLASDESAKTQQVTVESQRATLISYRDTTFQKKEWATVRWRMNKVSSNAFKEQNVEDKFAYVDRICSGITSYEALSTLWELTPWSWFADWFTTIGDNIAASNNAVGAYPTSICFMRTTTSRSVYRIKTKSSWLTIENVPYELEIRKGRWLVPLIGYLLPSVTMPILTNRHWSILGALAALRGTGRTKVNAA